MMGGHCVVFDTIMDFDQDAWDRCFPGEIENWAYYRAVEEAGIPGFSWRYVAILNGGKPIAAIPAFLTAYRLDTTVQGGLKRVTERLARRFPALLSIPLLCVGSPVTEVCQFGFAPEVAGDDKPGLLAALMNHLKDYARRHRIGLIAVKDARDRDVPLLGPAVAGFARMAGLPTASLPLPFKTLDAYLASLSSATRKDMRRKMRVQDTIRVEWRDRIDDVLDQVAALYEETEGRSDLQFEHLPPAYFANVLRLLAGRARCVLYWRDRDLLAFNLVLESPDRLVDKFIGTGALARNYNLYFLSWMENVRHCLAAGIPLYQSGQAGYAVKVRLGSRLSLNWNYFRHTNPLLNAVLRGVARLVRLDRFDPEIRLAMGGAK